jgi:hypothetical protein
MDNNREFATSTSTAASEIESEPLSDESLKIANERYRTVVAVFTTECTLFWSRSGFMLVAEAALFAGATRLLETATADSFSAWLVVSIGLMGFVLTTVWLELIKVSRSWTDWYLARVRDLEPAALGSIRVFRLEPREVSTWSLRSAPTYLASTMLLAWTLTLLRGVYLVVSAN